MRTVVVLLLFFSLIFAQYTTNVIITPSEESDRILHLSAQYIVPLTSSPPVVDRVSEVRSFCESASNYQQCILTKVSEINREYGYSAEVRYVENAVFTVELLNSITGQYTPVPGCSRITATDSSEELFFDSSGSELVVTKYYATCELPDSLPLGSNQFRIVFIPEDSTEFSPSYSTYNLIVVDSSRAEEARAKVLETISAILSSSSGLPCLSSILLLGLLFASLYFSGKSPLTYLDIVTPKLPSPPSMNLGGKTVLGFGYPELGKTLKTLTKKGSRAMLKSAQLLGAFGNRQVRLLRGRIKKDADNEAHLNAAETLLRAGAMLVSEGKLSRKKLNKLIKLPTSYKKEDHETAAEIIRALRKKGDNRSVLIADMLQNYFAALQVFKTQSELSGIPSNTRRAKVYSKVMKFAKKYYGINRYSIAGPLVPGLIGGVIRGTEAGIRFARATVKHSPYLGLAAVKASQQFVHLVAKSKVKEKAEEKIARMEDKLSALAKRAKSDVFNLGYYFQIFDKMEGHYDQLKNAAYADLVRHLLSAILKKQGLDIQLTEQEINRLIFEGLDVEEYFKLKELKLNELSEKLDRILKRHDPQQKIELLISFAREQGVRLDSAFFGFYNSLLHIDAEERTVVKYVKLIWELNKYSLNNRGYRSYVFKDNLSLSESFEILLTQTILENLDQGFSFDISSALRYSRLFLVNRVMGLAPATNMNELPPFLRNKELLQKIEHLNRRDLVALLTDGGVEELLKVSKKKSIQEVSIADIVSFLSGSWRAQPIAGYAAPGELWASKEHTRLNLKGQWLTELSEYESVAIAQWVQNRFNRGHLPPYDAEIEALLDRANVTEVGERKTLSMNLWVRKLLQEDLINAFNSLYADGAYGSLAKEKTHFYKSVFAGFVEKIMDDENVQPFDPQRKYLERFTKTNDVFVAEKLAAYSDKVKELLSKKVTYDDLAFADRVVASTYEGGIIFYRKGMKLADSDVFLNAAAVIRDPRSGKEIRFDPDNAVVSFESSPELLQVFNSLRDNPNPRDWKGFLHAVEQWAKRKDGSFVNVDRAEIYAAVLWRYAKQTGDLSSYWRNAPVEVKPISEAVPNAPSVFTFFGAKETGQKFAEAIRPFRDAANYFADYVAKIVMETGGPVINAQYDITPTTEYFRQRSFHTSFRILSGEVLEGLSEEEKKIYREAAVAHGAFHHVWDFTIDRNPWKISSSGGDLQIYAVMGHFGPTAPAPSKVNLGYMSKAEKINAYLLLGFPLDMDKIASKPAVGMVKYYGYAIKGFASRWDTVNNAFRQWESTRPRMREAFNMLNPFAFTWSNTRLAKFVSKLNVFGGSLEHHHLAGEAQFSGLRPAPQDTFLNRSGVYVYARWGSVNPAASYYDYRMRMHLDTPMADYLSRISNAGYLVDEDMRRDTLKHTVRRTISAEALAVKREDEQRALGVTQNMVYGWLNPILFVWHLPIPLWPQTWTIRDAVSARMARKLGYHDSWYNRVLGATAEVISQAVYSLSTPLKQQVWCHFCNSPGKRGSRCKCGVYLY